VHQGWVAEDDYSGDRVCWTGNSVSDHICVYSGNLYYAEDGDPACGNICLPGADCMWWVSPTLTFEGYCSNTTCAFKKYNGTACSNDYECHSDNCRKEIDSSNKYCAAAGKLCSENFGGHPGYSYGNVGNLRFGGVSNDDWICNSTDVSRQCTAGNRCDEYGGKYCNGTSTWVSGSSHGQEAGCAACTWCGGTSATDEGDLSCTSMPDNQKDEHGSNLCDGVCDACQDGVCGYADAGTDPGDDCSVGSWSCDGYCKAVRDSGTCDGAGACQEDDETAYASTNGKICSGGSFVDPTADNNCGISCSSGECTYTALGCTLGEDSCHASAGSAVNVSDEQVCTGNAVGAATTTHHCDDVLACTANHCSGTRYYLACGGGGTCRADITGAASQAENAPENQACSGTGPDQAWDTIPCRSAAGDCDLAEYCSSVPALTDMTGPGTVISSGAGVAWTNPSNAAADDGSYATASLDTYEKTQYLNATNFGFSIPEGSTIHGINVSIERKTGRDVADDVVSLLKDGVVVGDNKSGGYWPVTDTLIHYGDATDLWGEDWTPEDINNPKFGVVLKAEEQDDNPTADVYVDYIAITVNYTIGSGSCPADAKKSEGKQDCLDCNYCDGTNVDCQQRADGYDDCGADECTRCTSGACADYSPACDGIDASCYCLDGSCGSCLGSDHCFDYVCSSAGTNFFMVRNSTGSNQALISDTGNVVLAGTMFESCSDSPDSNAFLINAGALQKAWINNTGSMCIGGNLTTENSDWDVCAADSFLIKNSAGNTKACVNSTGDLIIAGKISEKSNL
jgi:hypothetical protein